MVIFIFLQPYRFSQRRKAYMICKPFLMAPKLGVTTTGKISYIGNYSRFVQLWEYQLKQA